MNKYEEQVLECHQAMELAINEPYSVELLKLRERLLSEELEELKVEIFTLVKELETNRETCSETKAKMFKELADLQYVLSGMVVALGIPMEEVFTRIHESNMSKLVNGKALKREDGKFLKGPNYQPPVLDDLAV